jgi:hypothetical protein
VMAVLLDGGCQPGAVAHLSHSLVAGCHHLDTRHPADVTCRAHGRHEARKAGNDVHCTHYCCQGGLRVKREPERSFAGRHIGSEEQ